MHRNIHLKTDSIQHHHHPEGVVYRNFCFNSGTIAVSKITSRRWWCVESLFPIQHAQPSGQLSRHRTHLMIQALQAVALGSQEARRQRLPQRERHSLPGNHLLLPLSTCLSTFRGTHLSNSTCLTLALFKIGE